MPAAGGLPRDPKAAGDLGLGQALGEQAGGLQAPLPGGLGTLEEIFEIIVGKQLRYHSKPIALLNTAGYFDPLLAMIDHGIGQQFIKPQVRELYFVANTVEEAVDYYHSYHPPQLDDKWFNGGGGRPPSGIE